MPKKKPVKLFTLDTETIGLSGSIRRIAIFDGDIIRYGFNFADIETYLLEASKDYSVHIYVHNLDFDARKCPEIFRKDNVKWKSCLVVNRDYVTIACQSYTLHDSFSLLPMSRKTASEQFELEHGKLDLWDEVKKVYPNQYIDNVDYLARCDVNDELYLKYLGYDVRALYELIIKLSEVSTIPIDKLVKCPTTASMSKYIFKNGFNGQIFQHEGFKKTDFEMLCTNKYWRSIKPMKESPQLTWRECEERIRETYCGGRTEVFKPKLQYNKGKIVGFHYDVNSLYPSVCKDNEFPIGVPHVYDKPSIISYKWRMWLKYKNGLGFIKCKVYVPEQHIPPLPSKKGKLCFLTGYLIGYWTYIELEYAVKNCGVQIIEFLEMIHFDKTFKVYENFIEKLNHLKEIATINGNKALRTFAKLLMNTAYGWTAMRRELTELDDIDNIEKYVDNERLIKEDRELGFVEVVADIRTESIQVQIASYVTSYARLVILDALRKQNSIGQVYYCDTDSIVCSAEMSPDMIDDVKLGYWGLEAVLSKGLFLQPKVYTEEYPNEDIQKGYIKAKEYKKGTVKFKGVTKGKQKTFDYSFYDNIYKRLCNKDADKIPIEEGQERLPSLITAQKKGIDPNTVTIVNKDMNLLNMQKRDINYKLNYTKPWHISSFEEFNTFEFKMLKTWEGDFFEKRR